MEKTGLLSDIVISLTSQQWKDKENLEKTKLAEKHRVSTNRALQVLKQLNKLKDIDELIKSEKMLIVLEKSVHQDIDKNVAGSLDAALEDFRVMEKSLHAVRSGNYEDASDSHHSKKKLNNIPVDGFHEGIKSHITRLGNRLAAVGISVPEKNVIHQRRDNMRAAKELYIGLQRKALGIEAPKVNKSKGLSR